MMKKVLINTLCEIQTRVLTVSNMKRVTMKKQSIPAREFQSKMVKSQN